MKRYYRLRRNNDFLQVRRRGKSYANAFVVLAYLQNDLEHNRFGFVVSKRLGNAVLRNRIKRQMREVVRLNMQTIKSGFDMVFIARKAICRLDYWKIEVQLLKLLRKTDLLIIASS